MTLYMLFAGIVVLTYVGAAALIAVSGVISRHVVFGADFAFLASLSTLLVATIGFAMRSVRVSASAVALMSGAAVTMMIVAAREPSAAQATVKSRQTPAVLTAAAPARQSAVGEQLFQELGCVSCHRPDGKGIGPALIGVFGRPLEGCGVLTADEEYVRESILNPTAVVATGFAPIMPSFAGRVSEEQLRALIACLESLRSR